MKRLLKILIGIILQPFLFMRWNWILLLVFLPSMVTGEGSITYGQAFQLILVGWICMNVFLSGIMMNTIGKLYFGMYIKLFNIKYEVVGKWASDMIYNFSANEHPTIVISGTHSFNTVVKTMGGNIYNPKASIMREVLNEWFFRMK